MLETLLSTGDSGAGGRVASDDRVLEKFCAISNATSGLFIAVQIPRTRVSAVGFRNKSIINFLHENCSYICALVIVSLS